MASRWRKAKVALGLCVYVPRTDEDGDRVGAGRFSDAVDAVDAAPPAAASGSGIRPMTPTPSSSGLRLSKTGSRSSKRTCAICLGSMKPGHGHAIFTAECGHSFHFHCIASNVKHGNQLCPVCRAKWKEIPFKGPSNEIVHDKARINPVEGVVHGGQEARPIRRLQSPRPNSSRHLTSLFQSSEPSVFDDDEAIDIKPSEKASASSTNCETAQHYSSTVDIKTCPEFSSLGHSTAHENFALLVHLKAPHFASLPQSSSGHANSCGSSSSCRTPVDLVTVLDVSGSMAGTKLALLKRAMGFVIHNLGTSDRLSVIAFSSTARRLFPLRRMSDAGKQQALQAVNSLISSGGTNIAEGLKKGAKVMEERKSKNPVSSIILLSDGQDTYTITSLNLTNSANSRPDYRSLLPYSISGDSGGQIPVHAFGFGADHDAASMHSISESSGGTFSFIEGESFIQDAFAQCIGGLLSVVVQELRLVFETADSRVKISSIKAGSYGSRVYGEGRHGSIDVGDLYAEEERDFLLFLNVPAGVAGQITPLVKVDCSYKNPISKEKIKVDDQVVKIQRVASCGRSNVSIEVDRQRNRLQTAEAMANALALAEQNDFGAAVSILEKCRKALADSASSRAGDHLCVALDAELKEMQERMASRRVYQTSGRAYVLSGLSSHSWQRATARGDSTESASLVHAYQTPSMVDMLTMSQTMTYGAPHTRPPVRPPRSFTREPQPR